MQHISDEFLESPSSVPLMGTRESSLDDSSRAVASTWNILMSVTAFCLNWHSVRTGNLLSFLADMCTVFEATDVVERVSVKSVEAT